MAEVVPELESISEDRQLPNLALAVIEPARVRELLKRRTPVTAAALIATIESKTFASNDKQKDVFEETEQSLELLLSAGTDPNLRLCGAAYSEIFGVQDGWATGSSSTEREFLASWRERYPLYWAGLGFIYQAHEKEHYAKLQQLLLNHGADPYALFRQPLRPRQPYHLFPGIAEAKDPTGNDLGYTAIDAYKYVEANEPFKYNVYTIRRNASAIAKAKEQGEDYSDDDGDDDDRLGFTESDLIPEAYGVRSLIHAMLEDGAFVEPLLDLPDLDIERRDPQGRTLLLSACRSALGFDSAANGCMGEVHWDVHAGRYFSNPFPQEPARIEAARKTTETTTLLQFFVNKKADFFAVDNYGKHALFQLLESYNSMTDAPWPSFISHSLKLLLERIPQLVNQPDGAGNYPIHAALRRLRRLKSKAYPERFAPELEGVIHDLLAGGADPKVRDELGNTVLHYLSGESLASEISSIRTRTLFQLFLGRDVDIKARNKAGQSALELFLQDDGYSASHWEKNGGLAAEFVGLFESSAVSLHEKGPGGQTLLHMVAKQDSHKAAHIVRHLRRKGLDPKSCDADGKTPIDLARECVPRKYGKSVLGVLLE